MVPPHDPIETRTNLGPRGEENVEPELLDFGDLFFEDSLDGKARPLAEYLQRFPRAEAAIAREWLRLMGAEEGAEASDSQGQSEEKDRGGHYQLIKELGRGGQGAVWLGQDTRIQRKAAIKFMPQGFGLISEEKKGRFRREAEVIARLEHPGLCRIYDADVEADSPWIAMRLIEGEDLSTRIGRAHTEDEASRSKEVLPVGPQSKAELHCILRFFERVSRAMHAAHEAGVIHRDIKPGNLRITPEGEPVVLDFGMARGDDLGLAELTASGDIFGTPSYMSPEQVRGASDEVDKRADVWALGVTLFEALTLERPFVGQGTGEILSSVLTGVPRRPSEKNPQVTDELDVVVATALERDLDRRYPSALEFAEELRRICEYEPIHARPAGPLLKLARWSRRHPALAASISISFLSLTAGLITTTYLRGKEQEALAKEQAARAQEKVALDHALGRHLAERSRTVLSTDPNRALRLGIDAVTRSPHEFTRSALVRAMTTSRLHASLPSDPRPRFTDLDISPQGDHAVMALNGSLARVYDLDKNSILCELDRHEADLLTARFTSSGTSVLTASADGHLISWTTEGEVIEERQLEMELAEVVVSAAGDFVVLTTLEGEAFLSPFGEEPLRRLELEAPVKAVGLMSADELVLTLDEEGVFRGLDVKSGALVLERSMDEPVSVMGSASTGAVVAIGTGGGEIELWDLAAGERFGELSHGEHLSGLRFSRGAEHLLSWGGKMARDGDGTLRVWSTESLEEISAVHGERAFVDAEFDPLGGRVVASNGTRTVGMYDLSDGTLIEKLTSPFLHTGLRWSDDGSRLASLSTTKYAPVWYMVQRESAPNTYTNLGAPAELLQSGDRTFVLHENGVLATWELETGAVSRVDTGAIGGVRGMSKAAAGDEILIWGEGGLGSLDVAGLELRWSLETEHAVASAQGDELTGAGLSEEGSVFSWSEGALKEDLGPAGCVALSPGGEWIATAGEGVEVTLHSTDEDVEDRTLSFEGSTKAPVTIFELLFHPGGGVLYVNTSERRIRMFQVDTGEEIGMSRGVQLREIRNSPDGKHILGTPGDRRFARILDSVTGKILRDNETHHVGDVMSADLDQESSFAVTGSVDGVLQVWRVEDGEAHWFHESGRGEVADVVFWGSGSELGVLAASRDGFLWGVPVYPLNSVDEHPPEALGSWIAHEETRYAQPFSYHPRIKSSGFTE